jgi:thiol-disulfide isomerase/thioredoxin
MNTKHFLVMTKYFYGLLLTVGLLACSSNPQNEAGFEKEEVSKQEEVTPQTLQFSDLEGNAIELDDFEGKAIFLNLWATWCRPCIMEMPSIEQAYQELKEEGYVFLAASYEDPEKIREFADKQDFTFPFIHLKSDMQALGVQSIPTTYIYNESGEVVARIIGSREWDSPELMARLQEWKTAEPGRE